MIDGHVHLEKGPLTVEYVKEFIEEAQRKGITHLQILDHTHRFKEFAPIYDDRFRKVASQDEWLKNDLRDSMEDYLSLIDKVRKLKLPIKVTFGLEVCYQHRLEDQIRECLKPYRDKLDFLIGSVHAIFDIAYDSPWSIDELWKKFPTDVIYKEYYDEVTHLIESDLFSQLGHPDTIKMFNYYPSYNQKETYQRIARLAFKHNILVENNTGCYYRYHHPDMGLNDEFLKIFKENHCKMITVSDAHRPGDVGNYIKDVWDKVMH